MMDYSQLRAEWLRFGGGIHGPNVETVTMTEEKYFEFRRYLEEKHALDLKVAKAEGRFEAFELTREMFADIRKPGPSLFERIFGK